MCRIGVRLARDLEEAVIIIVEVVYSRVASSVPFPQEYIAKDLTYKKLYMVVVSNERIVGCQCCLFILSCVVFFRLSKSEITAPVSNSWNKHRQTQTLSAGGHKQPQGARDPV